MQGPLNCKLSVATLLPWRMERTVRAANARDGAGGGGSRPKHAALLPWPALLWDTDPPLSIFPHRKSNPWATSLLSQENRWGNSGQQSQTSAPRLLRLLPAENPGLPEGKGPEAPAGSPSHLGPPKPPLNSGGKTWDVGLCWPSLLWG